MDRKTYMKKYYKERKYDLRNRSLIRSHREKLKKWKEKCKFKSKAHNINLMRSKGTLIIEKKKIILTFD